jgi:hypothetical protein
MPCTERQIGRRSPRCITTPSTRAAPYNLPLSTRTLGLLFLFIVILFLVIAKQKVDILLVKICVGGVPTAKSRRWRRWTSEIWVNQNSDTINLFIRRFYVFTTKTNPEKITRRRAIKLSPTGVQVDRADPYNLPLSTRTLGPLFLLL